MVQQRPDSGDLTNDETSLTRDDRQANCIHGTVFSSLLKPPMEPSFHQNADFEPTTSWVMVTRERSLMGKGPHVIGVMIQYISLKTIMAPPGDRVFIDVL